MEIKQRTEGKIVFASPFCRGRINPRRSQADIIFAFGRSIVIFYVVCMETNFF